MEAIITAFVLLIYLILCGISFVGGFYLGMKERPEPIPNEPSEEEKRQIERSRREFENFMNYNGRPQDVINDN
jgi:hypothetical protein